MEDRLPSKLAVILHADIVDSTALVQLDESVAHQRFQDAFKRFSDVIEAYNGTAQEIRGDALVAEFGRASDAVSAALAFQAANEKHNRQLTDEIRPVVRVGISLGEVVVADGTITGAGVVLAQRLEQLADPNGVVIQGAVREAVPTRLPYEFGSLGDYTLKGFEQSVGVYSVALEPGEEMAAPEPEAPTSDAPPATSAKPSDPKVSQRRTHNWPIFTAVALVVIGVTVFWINDIGNDSLTRRDPPPKRQIPCGAGIDPPGQAALESDTDSNQTWLMSLGNEYLRLGDFASARLYFEEAANEGSARAATALGKTYDDVHRERENLQGPPASMEKAIQWYRKALAGGDPEAESLLRALCTRVEEAAARGDAGARKLLDEVNA